MTAQVIIQLADNSGDLQLLQLLAAYCPLSSAHLLFAFSPNLATIDAFAQLFAGNKSAISDSLYYNLEFIFQYNPSALIQLISAGYFDPLPLDAETDAEIFLIQQAMKIKPVTFQKPIHFQSLWVYPQNFDFFPAFYGAFYYSPDNFPKDEYGFNDQSACSDIQTPDYQYDKQVDIAKQRFSLQVSIFKRFGLTLPNNLATETSLFQDINFINLLEFFLDPYAYSLTNQQLTHNKEQLAALRQVVNSDPNVQHFVFSSIRRHFGSREKHRILKKVQTLHKFGFQISEFELARFGVPTCSDMIQKKNEHKNLHLLRNQKPSYCEPCIRLQKLEKAQQYAQFSFPLIKHIMKEFLIPHDINNMIADLSENIEEMDSTFEDPYAISIEME